MRVDDVWIQTIRVIVSITGWRYSPQPRYLQADAIFEVRHNEDSVWATTSGGHDADIASHTFAQTVAPASSREYAEPLLPALGVALLQAIAEARALAKEQRAALNRELARRRRRMAD
jgi:hypothetical protein